MSSHSRFFGVVLTSLGLIAATLSGPPARAELPISSSPGAAEASRPSPRTTRIAAVEAIEVVVGDADRASRFFESVLGFERQESDDLEVLLDGRRARVRRITLALGSEKLRLLAYRAPHDRGRPVPRDTRGNDHWFQHIAIVVRDMDAAYAWLRNHDVSHVSSGPQTLPQWNRAAAGIRAFYFADPDGHALELIQFPPGKGDPRWQRRVPCTKTPRALCLFLGIDHTAITVESTRRSLAFYRDALGLRVAGESENHGTEQERLNGVFGARLRITALRAEAGPGIELLEYLAPRGGRAMPADARENDLFHWQVAVRAERTGLTGNSSAGSGSAEVEPALASPPFLLRDPDGHALRIERSGTTHTR